MQRQQSAKLLNLQPTDATVFRLAHPCAHNMPRFGPRIFGIMI